MAGDWIKMRQDLHDDPAVIGLSTALAIDEDSVVGKLHRLWCWADKHTSSGYAPAITSRWVDRYVCQTGFADAMVSVGWLGFTEDGVQFPNFDRHNGQSAKTRADAAVRQRLSRENRDKGVTGVTRTSLPKPFVRHVMERDNYTCVYCGTTSTKESEESRKGKLSIDHIVPETRNGGASVDNLVCACRLCNGEKNDRTPEEWGVFPTFLQDGLTYTNGKIAGDLSLVTCDKSVTREEKRREDISKPNGLDIGARKKKGSPLPENFEPDATGIAFAEERGIAIDTEVENFRNWHQAKGSLMVNWQAAWRTWCGKARQFTRPATGSNESFYEREQRLKAERMAAFTGKAPRQAGNVIDVTPTARRIGGAK